ncbi:putative biofilm formation methyltransferase WspC [compost metagenome]
MTAAGHPRLDLFRQLVAGHLGMTLADVPKDTLASLVAEQAHAHGETPDAYLERLKRADGEAWKAMAERLTIGETYFYRHPEQFRAFAQVVLPELIAARQAERSLRLLSAGCSTGEEAYTLAMILQDHARELEGWEITVDGIDLNSLSVNFARQGLYSAWALRRTPTRAQRQYFREVDGRFQLTETVRSTVRFNERNLLESDSTFWRPGAFDVIFYRNVGIYLSLEARQTIVERFASSLSPGGFFFLGPAETLRGVSERFELLQSHESFFYRLRGHGRSVEAPPIARPRERRAAFPSLGSFGPPAPGQAAPGNPMPASAAVSPPEDLFTLIRRERFAEALGLLDAQDAEASAMRAALCLQLGRVDEAIATCQARFNEAPFDAEAHYVQALCREQQGDVPGARKHAELAAYHDPAFAMPHVHLGMLAKRHRDPELAQRAWKRAMALLPSEREQRLTLYGGGFRREALIALCREELARGGGRS